MIATNVTFALICDFLDVLGRLWNEIPRRIRDLPKKEFKGEIRRLLLNILVNENDNIETPIIVQKIGLSVQLVSTR